MTRTPIPVRKPRVTSPLRESEDDFSDMPAYVPITHAPRVGKLRKRKGVEELAQIVGSNMFRDITRSSNFMPGQFELWNNAANGGNKKYWGGYEDLDGDDIAHEFVVRRGGIKGPVIAVNGYTTKQSDWGARKLYYETYPKRVDRKGKTVKSFMRDEYYEPHYNGMTIDGWGIQPGDATDEFKAEEWKRYKKYTPKNLSPYQAVNKYIVQPALDQYLAAMNMTKTQYLAMYGGVGALSRLASEIYFSIVKAPVDAYLEHKGVRQKLERDFLDLKGGDTYLEDPDCPTEFEKYIFSRKSVKDLVVRYVRGRVLPNAKTLITALATKIEGDHLKDPTPIPSPVPPPQGGDQDGSLIEFED